MKNIKILKFQNFVKLKKSKMLNLNIHLNLIESLSNSEFNLFLLNLDHFHYLILNLPSQYFKLKSYHLFKVYLLNFYLFNFLLQLSFLQKDFIL